LDRYEPKDIENRIYKEWEKNGYFEPEEASNKPPFSIVIPPPNVTGSLHMGHALNNTLQDILARYKRARGYNVLWLPGCDHAGIATQNVVERELKKEKKTKEELGREKFTEKVWQWKEKYGAEIMRQLRRLGSSLAWTRERFTMDEGLSNAVKEVFVSLYEEGLIYRGDYLINWCPRCRTALSDIEAVHKEINGNFWHIRYPFADGSGRYIEVATTRPETMLGDTAVAVNPEDARYVDIKEGTRVILPETGRKIPIIKDSYVDKDFGTGAVKITPAHDPNDFEVGARHKLEIINVMNENGTMNEKAGESGKYSGLDRFEARKRVVEALDSLGLLVKTEPHKHAVSHCYRCDTVVEPYISTQWFVKTGPMAKEAIRSVEEGRVKFVPDMWEKVYFEWMRNIKDWCISRQLWWGHRIPAYYCGCGGMVVAKEAPEKCPECGGAGLKQDEDVLDTWFSSALWPFSTLGWPEKTKDLQMFYPTSVLVTSWDILFFWVARMIMTGVKFMGKEPFHTVVINSLVCDAQGKKMSKSKGNVVDPLGVIESHSADALRYTMAALETQQRHISFSDERLKGYSVFMNKIWNASKFAISNLGGVGDVYSGGREGLKLPERWILGELDSLIERVTRSLEEYRFSEAAVSLYEFFWHSFCDWYIETAKIEIYKEESEYAGTVKKVLAKVLKESIIMMHPVIPFITEEIYSNLPLAAKTGTIMKESWPEAGTGSAGCKEEMETLMRIIYTIRNIRGELEIGPGEKAEVYMNLEADAAKIAEEYGEIIKILGKASGFIREKKPVFIGRQPAGTGEIGINGDQIKDAAGLIKRKSAALLKLESRVKSVERKLLNADFKANAPVKVIAEEEEKLAKMKADAEALKGLIIILEKAV